MEMQHNIHISIFEVWPVVYISKQRGKLQVYQIGRIAIQN